MSNRVKYSIDDEIAHIDNLQKKMRVREVIFANSKISHIVCSWWGADGELKKMNAHSHALIPWGIANQGQEQVDSYLESIEKEKTVERIKNEHR